MLPVSLDGITPGYNHEALNEKHRVEAHLNSHRTHVDFLADRQKGAVEELEEHADEVDATDAIESVGIDVVQVVLHAPLDCEVGCVGTGENYVVWHHLLEVVLL